MSLFRATEGEFAGSERMTYLSAKRYHARGQFVRGGDVISAWSMELVRQS